MISVLEGMQMGRRLQCRPLYNLRLQYKRVGVRFRV
jgi:hypothetical protein